VNKILQIVHERGDGACAAILRKQAKKRGLPRLAPSRA